MDAAALAARRSHDTAVKRDAAALAVAALTVAIGRPLERVEFVAESTNAPAVKEKSAASKRSFFSSRESSGGGSGSRSSQGGGGGGGGGANGDGAPPSCAAGVDESMELSLVGEYLTKYVTIAAANDAQLLCKW